MAWWQVLITVGSVLTALGIIVGVFNKWAGRFAKTVVRKYGVAKELKELAGVVDEMSKNVKIIKDELDANTRLTLKLELKSLFINHPECTQVIELTMAKYRSLGGDSYIDTLYEEWKEKYEKPILRNGIGRGTTKVKKGKK